VSDPLITLLIGTGIIFFLTIIFWPEKGLIARWSKANKDSSRVLLEDALKHLHDCEYKQSCCTEECIAKGLIISSEKASEIVSKLTELDLVITKGKELELTSEGRSYALRMVRIHRLWERYLADKTSIKESDWHSYAEDLEHKISSEEADRMAAQLGNPVFDPHGDPIPTADGKLPIYKGVLLTELEEGDVGIITHIEDEPKDIFAQINAIGLYPGMQIMVNSTSESRVKFEAEGEESVLAPSFAENITVQKIKEEEVATIFESLSNLQIGEKAEVVGISSACRGPQRRRLMDFGIVPGAKVKAQMISTGGDPVAYEIRDTLVALRKAQSNLIYIRKHESEVA